LGNNCYEDPVLAWITQRIDYQRECVLLEIYTLENDFLKMVVSKKGAELLEVIGKSDGYPYLWQGEPAFWGSRAPVLFPIIGNLNQGKYRYDGKEYRMQRHGFAAKSDFECWQNDVDEISFSLTHSQATLSQYPFEFRLDVRYRLQNSTITTEYRVENTGSRQMWFSIGGHPGFHCSLNSEGKKAGRLIFERNETVNRLVNELGYLTGREEPFLSAQNIIDLATVDFDSNAKVYIMKNLTSEQVTLEDQKSGKQVRLRFPGFPYLGIWSPSNNAPFVCIEPWYGITSVIADSADELEHKPGIQGLAPGECFICSYDITCL
jgi:galactose mutarotase-like enzyme